MIESAVDVRRERVLTGVATRTVAAIVAECDGLGERDIESERSGHRHCDLGDLEGMSETGALMVVGKDEHLGLTGEATERRGVQDAIAIAFETRSEGIGLFVDGPSSGAHRSGGESGEMVLGAFFALLPLGHRGFTGAGP